MRNKVNIEELGMRIEQAKEVFNPNIFPKPWVALDTGSSGTNPRLCDLRTITVVTENEERVFVNKEEKYTVLDALNFLLPYRDGTCFGFNLCFDKEIIDAACERNKIFMRFGFARYLDLRLLFSRGDLYCKGKLCEYASAIGLIPPDTEWRKSHARLLEIEPDLPSLKSFLLWDSRAVMQLVEYLSAHYRASNDQ